MKNTKNKLWRTIAIILVIGFVAIACDNGAPPVTVTGGSASQTPATPQPFNDITATQLVANIKVGWNLGNSLDAHHLTWLPANPTVTQMETGWSNPVTTKAMITAIKNAGFNAIRIPVSWTKAASGAPNYTIRADWMARVVEIVNYAAENDMYIILNTHHDEDVLTFMNSNAAAGKAAFQKLWEQIADTFKNYNEKLIFEGLNEPRTIDSANEWNGGTSEERANLNSYYPIFVNTVRNSGGNNNKRFLMINPYAASATSTAVNALTLPADTAANKLIVSIHAYTPYDFCYPFSNTQTPNWSSSNSSDTNSIQAAIQPAYDKFVSKGIPVIIGEFGSVNKNNNTAARAAWAEYYVTYAKSKGIACFFWDNGLTTSSKPDEEPFGIFNRSSSTFAFPEIKNALMNGANSATPITPPPATPTPPTITGNLGNYRFGLKEDGVSPNYEQAVWELSGANLTTAKTVGAKLVLVLSAAPIAVAQFVWQGPDTAVSDPAFWWKQKDILNNDGSVIGATGVTWNSGTKTLTIPLSVSSVEDYTNFTSQTSLNIIIAYYGGSNVNALGIVSANLQP